jgi:hypothetical protein
VGPVEYLHVLFVFKPGLERPYLVVASEYPEGAADPTSPFLTLFFGGTHFNRGHSSDWAELDKFTEEALLCIVEPLGMTETPYEVPLHGTHTAFRDEPGAP